MGQTIEELKALKINDGPSHWGLIEKTTIEKILIPQLSKMVRINDADISLSDISQGTVEDFISSTTKRKAIFPLFSRKTEDLTPKIMELVDVFNGLAQAARKGPTNIMPLDIRVVQEFFTKWLTRYMSLEEAEENYRHYGSETKFLHDLGPLLPAEISENFINTYKIAINAPVKMNSNSWLEHWKKLDNYPGLWNDLLAEPQICSLVRGRPNLKMPNSHMQINLEIIKKYVLFLGIKDTGVVDQLARKDEGIYLGNAPIYQNADVVKFLQQMTAICQYSQEKKCTMLEMAV